MTPSPQLQAVFARLAETAPAYLDALYPAGDMARARALLRGMFTGETPQNVSVRALKVGAAQCEWLIPHEATADRRLLYAHGGGYVAGDLDTHRSFAAQLARAGRCIVLNVDYRLAPEHPPEALREDVLVAWRHMLANGPDGAGQARRVFMAGDSAGVGLIASAMLELRDAGERLPDAAISFCGAFDMSDGGAGLPEEERPRFRAVTEMYVQGRDPKSTLISPLYGDLSALPPMLLQVSDIELGYAANVRFAEKAKAAGVDVTFSVSQGLPHDWQMFAPAVPEAAASLGEAGAFLRARD